MPYAVVYEGADCLKKAKEDSKEGKISRAGATHSKREIEAFRKNNTYPFAPPVGSIESALVGNVSYLGEANGIAIGLGDKDGRGNQCGVAVSGRAIVEGSFHQKEITMDTIFPKSYTKPNKGYPYVAVYTGADCLKKAKEDSVEGKILRAGATHNVREIRAFRKNNTYPFAPPVGNICAALVGSAAYLGEANGIAIGLGGKDGRGNQCGVAVSGKAIVEGSFHQKEIDMDTVFPPILSVGGVRLAIVDGGSIWQFLSCRRQHRDTAAPSHLL